MKKLVFTLLIALAPALFASAQTLKFGKVDSQRIFSLMPGKAEAEAKLNDISARYKVEYDMLREEFNRKYADFQTLRNEGNTPESIKERRMQEIQENNMKMDEFTRMVNDELKQKEAELVGPLKTRIADAIEEVGDEQHCTVIFDTADAKIAYLGKQVVDLTPAVLKKLGINAAATE